MNEARRDFIKGGAAGCWSINIYLTGLRSVTAKGLLKVATKREFRKSSIFCRIK